MSLLLRRELASLIRAGQKTQHLLRISQHPHCPFIIGESYAVQPYDMRDSGPPKVGASSCRVRVVAVWETELGKLTDDDARQEGFEDRAGLFAWWRQRFNEGPLISVPLWCVRFEIDNNERERWMGESGHAHGSADETSDEARGYVHSTLRALEPEAPAVPESWLVPEVESRHRHWGDTAHERKAQRRVDDRRRIQGALLEGLSPDDQAVVLDLCVALREAQRTDRSRQVAAIRRRIDAIRNKARKDRAA